MAKIPEKDKIDYVLTCLEPSAYRAAQLMQLADELEFEEFCNKLRERFDGSKTTNDYKMLFKDVHVQMFPSSDFFKNL